MAVNFAGPEVCIGLTFTSSSNHFFLFAQYIFQLPSRKASNSVPCVAGNKNIRANLPSAHALPTTRAAVTATSLTVRDLPSDRPPYDMTSDPPSDLTTALA